MNPRIIQPAMKTPMNEPCLCSHGLETYNDCGGHTSSQEVAELRRQIAMEQAARQKKGTKAIDSDMPTEFECCFCTSKVHPQLSISIPFNISW